MKIEVTEHSVSETALHRGVHDEAWVRILHNDIHLDTWNKFKFAGIGEENVKILDSYSGTPCAQYSGLELDDESGPDEKEGYQFEDWFVFPREPRLI